MIVNNEVNRPISVGLLGAGYIADYHWRAIRALPQASIKAVCDLNRRAAEQFAQSRGIPHVYSHLDEMLAQEQLDVVHVLTPPHIHFETARQIVGAGVDVLVEKPLCHRVVDCQKLRQLAQANDRVIGVSHNFLYLPVYEKLVADLRSGRLGQIDRLDIVWSKELGQLKGGPFSAWLLQDPKNILFEVCPHSFAHLIHLLGQPDTLTVTVGDRVELPKGLEFYRCWEIQGWKGNTTLRLRFSFIDGYPEHYISIRGTNAVAHVDFENNTYTCQEHTPYLVDVDRYLTIVSSSRDTFVQAHGTLAQFLLSKLGRSNVAAPYPYSIMRTVESFYQGRSNQLDERVSSQLGEAAVTLAERVAQEINLPTPQPTPSVEFSEPLPPSTVLVLGGTGFIGQALVRRLRQEGYGVRLLSRSPQNCPTQLKQLGVELVKGDFSDVKAVREALAGIDRVYHLARGSGKTWSDYLLTDVEPTRQLAQLCLEMGIKRLFYASSISIYYASKRAGTITEGTPPHPGMMRVSPYTRSKVENEKILLEYYHQGLPVVIFRPGVVLGSGGSPYHWGIAAWPYSSVCNLWGDGNNPLPIVLVDDVADAMVRALTVPGIEGESYNLVAPPSISANEYLDELEKRANLKLQRVTIPNWRYYLEALVKWAIKRVGGDLDASFPSYADLEGRSLAASFDCSKAEQQLGWSPVKDRETIIHKGIYIPVDEFF